MTRHVAPNRPILCCEFSQWLCCYVRALNQTIFHHNLFVCQIRSEIKQGGNLPPQQAATGVGIIRPVPEFIPFLHTVPVREAGYTTQNSQH